MRRRCRQHFVQNVLSEAACCSKVRACVCVCIANKVCVRGVAGKPANAYLILVISKDNCNS